MKHFATIIDGYTDSICPVGILLRVAKQLQPMPQSPTRFPTESLMDNNIDV
jgi:hypothetical protein